MVPKIRIQACNELSINPQGDYILYWMTANRRPHWNFSLDRAIEWAVELQKPLLVLEALRCGYPWASDRLHTFVLNGMADNARSFNETNVTYYPYVEARQNAGKGLLAALAEKACAVITDDFPSFFLPKMTQAAAKQVKVRMEKVDSNGLLPMRVADRVFPTAYAFRRFLQKNLPEHLMDSPMANPLHGIAVLKASIPENILKRWPIMNLDQIENGALSRLPIDHSVKNGFQKGGMQCAEQTLQNFLEKKLEGYSELRNEPEKEGTSGLSPYLHFGHISVHQVFSETSSCEKWNVNLLSDRTDGSRMGWWGMTKTAESFLDELVTWRELGYNMCWQKSGYDQYESLPEWAQRTLAEHANDPREYIYDLEEFEQSRTHDPLWNAAQRQLVIEGRIHNYLRMLWGKKILEWTNNPREALAIMIQLNNKYALDGRNPNSYSGIFWTLGRYDRAWGPERPIFGKIRYMSSDNTARKFKVKAYIARHTGGAIDEPGAQERGILK